MYLSFVHFKLGITTCKCVQLCHDFVSSYFSWSLCVCWPVAWFMDVHVFCVCVEQTGWHTRTVFNRFDGATAEQMAFSFCNLTSFLHPFNSPFSILPFLFHPLFSRFSLSTFLFFPHIKKREETLQNVKLAEV